MTGNNLLLVPYTKLEESPSGYFFWLENSTERRHVGAAASFYNENTKQLRIARWVLRKNAEAWGIRVDKYTVSIVDVEVDTPETTVTEEADLPVLEIKGQLDKLEQVLKALRKLLG
jgi:hypothetical protein